MPTLDRITVYPIKSFDGHQLSSCEVLSNGGLANDRRYALVDSWGKYINGKSCAEIHAIRAKYSDDLHGVSLSFAGQERSFEIATEQDALASWCGEVLGKKCRLIENSDGGFPDDCESPGPTLVSTATLLAVTEWFPGMDLAEVRRRFRFNLELANAPPFWEDCLVTGVDNVLRFRVGDLIWQGRGVCERCVVPTRDSLQGEAWPGFARDFVRKREAELPDWSPRERFDHFYRLGVNTRIDSCDNGDVLRVGDAIEKIR